MRKESIFSVSRWDFRLCWWSTWRSRKGRIDVIIDSDATPGRAHNMKALVLPHGIHNPRWSTYRLLLDRTQKLRTRPRTSRIWKRTPNFSNFRSYSAWIEHELLRANTEKYICLYNTVRPEGNFNLIVPVCRSPWPKPACHGRFTEKMKYIVTCMTQWANKLYTNLPKLKIHNQETVINHYILKSQIFRFHTNMTHKKANFSEKNKLQILKVSSF